VGVPNKRSDPQDKMGQETPVVNGGINGSIKTKWVSDKYFTPINGVRTHKNLFTHDGSMG